MADPTADLARLLRLEVDPTDLHERLRMVIDPELGINIVDLGLVYGVEVFGSVARVRMTTTTPACPIGSYLTALGAPLGLGDSSGGRRRPEGARPGDGSREGNAQVER
jgi:hypothetical protein